MFEFGIIVLIGMNGLVGFWIGYWCGTKNCVTKEQLDQMRTHISRQAILLQATLAALNRKPPPTKP